MKHMLPFQQKMICQTCPSQKQMSHSIHVASQMIQNLQRYISRAEKKHPKKVPYLFDSAHSCRYLGKGCPQFSQKERELNHVEKKLEQVAFDLLQTILTKKENNEDYSHLQHNFLQSLRGHYPKAFHYFSKEINR